MDINSINFSMYHKNGNMRGYYFRFNEIKKLNPKINSKFLKEFNRELGIGFGPEFAKEPKTLGDYIDIIDYILYCVIMNYKFKSYRTKQHGNDIKEKFRYIVEWGA